MAHRAPIVISPYSDAWPRCFAKERDRLLAALPEGFEIEHVGSTSVPGLAAKPIIDMLLGAASLDAIDAVIPVLGSLGYDYRPEHEATFPQRRFLAAPLVRPRRFHLHGVVQGGAFWRDHIAFRDRLRGSAALAAEYAALKRRLARACGDDRGGYTHAKSAFILGVLSGDR